VRVADDLVKRRFRPSAPNVLWLADITYLRSWEGWLYLAAVQDAYSRAVVGWSMAEHMRAKLVVDALGMGLSRRRPDPGLVHHSDQGSQPGLKRSSQQCSGMNVRELRRRPHCGHWSRTTRLSSWRSARRAGRSGVSRVGSGRARHEAP
jgi:transposase InsO family protein